MIAPIWIIVGCIIFGLLVRAVLTTGHPLGIIYIIAGLSCAGWFVQAVLYVADELGITGAKKMTIRNTLICLAKFVIIIFFVVACVLSLGTFLLLLTSYREF
jgi:hypothetical protein